MGITNLFTSQERGASSQGAEAGPRAYDNVCQFALGLATTVKYDGVPLADTISNQAVLSTSETPINSPVASYQVTPAAAETPLTYATSAETTPASTVQPSTELSEQERRAEAARAAAAQASAEHQVAASDWGMAA